jgi:hypothetical protein
VRRENSKFSALSAASRQRSSSKVPRNWPISRQELEELLDDSIEFLRFGDWGTQAATSPAG